MTVKRLAPTLLPLLLLALTASASPLEPVPKEIQPILTGKSYRYKIKDFGEPVNLPFTQLTTGRFGGDPQTDVVILRGNSPTLMVNPTLWDAALQVPVQAYAIATLTGTADQGFDEILTTTDEGLRAWRRRTATQSWEERAMGRDIGWDRATILGTAQIDGLQGQDVYGVTELGDYALVLLADSGDPDGFAPEIAIPQPDPPEDMVVLDLDSDGDLEVAVVSDTGIRIYSHEGTLLTSYADHSGGFLAAVDGPGGSERIAWVTKNANGNRDHLFFATLQGLTTNPVDLNRRGVKSVQTGDVDNDGDRDIICTQTATHQIYVLENRNGQFSIASGSEQSLGLAIPGPALDNQAECAIVDLDHDGDLDLFFPIQSREKAWVFRNAKIDHEASAPALLDPVYFNHDFIEDESVGFLQLGFADTEVPPGSTHLEVAFWRKADLATNTAPNPEPGQVFQIPVGSRIYRTGIITLPDPNPSIYFWSQRYVRLNTATGNLLEVHPALVFGFTTEFDETSPILTYLLGEAGAKIHTLTETDDTIHHQGGQQEFESVATVVTLTPVPDFYDDDEPTTQILE